MLDRKFILENVSLVEQNCRDRGVVVDVQKLATLEQQRRNLQAEAEEANRQANAASKAIGKAADEQERELRKEEGRQLRGKKMLSTPKLRDLKYKSVKYIQESLIFLIPARRSVLTMPPIEN